MKKLSDERKRNLEAKKKEKSVEPRRHSLRLQQREEFFDKLSEEEKQKFLEERDQRLNYAVGVTEKTPSKVRLGIAKASFRTCSTNSELSI